MKFFPSASFGTFCIGNKDLLGVSIRTFCITSNSESRWWPYYNNTYLHQSFMAATPYCITQRKTELLWAWGFV